MKNLSHRTTSNVGTLLWQTTVSQIATCMLRVCHIHIADDINNATVGLLRQTLVLTSVTCLHMEDRNMKALGTNHAQATVGITYNQHCIRLGLNHHLI